MMHSLYATLLVALFLTVVLAAPTVPQKRQGRSFVVKRFPNPKYVKSGRYEVRKVYNKYGWKAPGQGPSQKSTTSGPAVGAQPAAKPANKLAGPPSGQQPAAGGVAQGIGSKVGAVVSVPGKDEREYLSPILIGGQQFNVNFDTGSSNLWVFGTENPSPGHGAYDKSKSSTFQEIPGASFNISYGDNSTIHGGMGTDVVFIGGATVDHQAFGIAKDFSEDFQNTENQDGLLGLAFSGLSKTSPTPQKSFFENIMSYLEKPLFTADLRDDASGTYEFGFIDDSKHTGSVSYVPIDNSRGYWQLTATAITINGNPAKNTISRLPTIADTGTSTIMLDDKTVAEYYSLVPGAWLDSGNYIFPCGAQLPDLGITFDSYTAKVPGKFLTYGKLGKSGNCSGALLPNPVGQPMQVLGGPFFKANFVVFDGGKKQIGIAPH